MAERRRGPWLNSWTDRLAGVNTTVSCFKFVDLAGDGDYRLVVATKDAKLRAYHGTALEAELTLPERAVAISAFHSGGRTPILSVASGSCVYLFREFRAYGKFQASTNILHYWSRTGAKPNRPRDGSTGSSN